MTEDDLLNLIQNRENETLEFKEWKGNIPFDGGNKMENKRCFLGYCVAIANELGGYIIAGVKNDGEIIGTSAQISNDFKKKVFDILDLKIELFEISTKEGRVIVFKIPSRPQGRTLKFAGAPLMRIDDSLEIMTDEEISKILNETKPDWSVQFCNIDFNKLDSQAIQELRTKYKEKNGEVDIEKHSDLQVLSDLKLISNGKITNTCLLLLGDKDIIDEKLPQTEICFEYRNNVNEVGYVERVDFRKPLIFSLNEIWNKVNLRQQTHQISEGLFKTEIKAYNEEVFREALFNAVCHRDYTRTGSIYIKQSPQQIEIASPGGFPIGTNIDNLITAPSNPRNRFLSEVLHHVFRGVERSGQGADKIFKYTISEGKGEPDYHMSDEQNVILKISATLQDENFVKYLNTIHKSKNMSLGVDNLVLLEKIRKGIKEGVNIKTIKYLLENGLIEKYGNTSNSNYILSREYYEYVGELGIRTKRIGLSRSEYKSLIMKHLSENRRGRMSEFRQIFSTLKTKDITNLLVDLKNEGKIIKKGTSGTAAYWELVV